MSELMRELETYEKMLPELSTNTGKFALIHGDDLVGIYDTYGDALTVGYDKFDLEPFMVRKISIIPDVRCLERPAPLRCR